MNLQGTGNRVAPPPCLFCPMDKLALRGHMWTSSQNAQLDHMHPLRRHLDHRGSAYGLTRFACQTAVFQKSKGEEGISQAILA